MSAYELQCRAAYATEYTAAIDIRKLSGELMVEPPPAHRSHRLHTVMFAEPR
ncbi:hypothetical protein ABZ783_36555 [Micromonospora sp. NPDC047738]|uniref:hypothetical protein n=1 Tax=Micromonospora sp. NPDC047738 TaxID=3155741 RepID=UPI0033FC7BFA